MRLSVRNQLWGSVLFLGANSAASTSQKGRISGRYPCSPRQGDGSCDGVYVRQAGFWLMAVSIVVQSMGRGECGYEQRRRWPGGRWWHGVMEYLPIGQGRTPQSNVGTSIVMGCAKSGFWRRSRRMGTQIEGMYCLWWEVEAKGSWEVGGWMVQGGCG